MTPRTQSGFRHSIRPLSVFSFCGQPIETPRDQYHLETRALPQCPECKRAREKVVLVLGRKNRRLV